MRTHARAHTPRPTERYGGMTGGAAGEKSSSSATCDRDATTEVVKKPCVWCVHVHTHTSTLAQHTPPRKRKSAHTHESSRACVRARAHTHTHTYIHTYIHTNSHTSSAVRWACAHTRPVTALWVHMLQCALYRRYRGCNHSEGFA